MSNDNHLYECSDGNYYGNAEVWNRLEAGQWTPVDWDDESGTEWVENQDGDVLRLDPVSEDTLPPDVQVVETETGVRVEA
jgi:hypothetical protein